MTALTLIPTPTTATADHILESAVTVALRLIRTGSPNAARLILDRAQRHVAPMLTEACA